MSGFSKFVVAFLAVLSLLFVKDKFFGGMNFDFFKQDTKIENKEQINDSELLGKQLNDIKEEIGKDKKSPVKKVEKSYSKVAVFYLVADKSGGATVKKIYKTNDSQSDKLTFAIKELLSGPSWSEKSKGAYSEIPKGTRLLGIEHQGNNVIINLSSDFQYGGGTDSIYSRMRQLIKTALSNSNGKNIYLYLDGKQVEVIGGEGIMISQPLSENSLDE